MTKKDVIDELKKAMVLTNRENQKRIYAIKYAITALELDRDDLLEKFKAQMKESSSDPDQS